MSAGGGKPAETIDSKLARAGRLFLSAHDSDQIDGDILLSEARETVAALVEALKEAANELEWAGAELASQRARSAIRAAGEVL